jgi:hypothetical protein
VVKGTVLDVAPAAFEQRLKDYDPQLYVRWNPRKLKRHGCWEIRRRDTMKSIVDWAEFEGNCYTRLEYAENELVNHVLDCAFLNYDALRKLQEMDTWNKGYGVGSIVDQAERNLDHHRAQLAAKAKADMAYQLKQHKSEWRDLKDEIARGMDPSQIAAYWGRGSKH